MTEVANSSRPQLFNERLILDSHSLYQKGTNEPTSADAIYTHIIEASSGIATTLPKIEDLDKAYATRSLKYARHILDRLTRYEPCFYSSEQNRITLNHLAHPIQRYLAVKEHHEVPSGGRLSKDIEAIYGRGGEQLAFLLEQFEAHANINPGLSAEVEGGLSELIVFLLSARELTDEVPYPYLAFPSTQAQDRARVTANGMHHGFDLSVIRQRDSTIIPVQVKTSRTYAAQYPSHILNVSVADLVRDNNATPRMLAEAMYFEINGAKNYDEALIEAASKRLLNAFENY